MVIRKSPGEDRGKQKSASEAKRPVKPGDSSREEPGHGGAGSEAASTGVEGMTDQDTVLPRPA